MKLKQWLAVSAAALGLAVSGSASACNVECGHATPDSFMDRDFAGVQDWIKSKRSIPLCDKAADLMLSGDIRMSMKSIREKRNGTNMRGSSAQRDLFVQHGARIGGTLFDVDFNLMFDYRAGCTWAVAHVGFDNSAGFDANPRGGYLNLANGFSPNAATLPTTTGIESGGTAATPTGTVATTVAVTNPTTLVGAVAGDPQGMHGSGTCCNVCLKKAFFGWNIFEECNSRLDLEIGRRDLGDVFDSRVQFGSRFDGALLRYSNSFECVGDFYVNAGGFVIDQNSNHFGWVVEAGLMNICDYGVDVKYSYIDMGKNGTNRWNIPSPFGTKARVSQFTVAYNFDAEYICKKSQLYGAFLMNHAAKKQTFFNNRREAFGWYVGASFGEIVCEGDWMLDVNYQYVQANAFQERDLTGIGRGNVHGVPISISNWNAASVSSSATPGSNPSNVADFGWLNYQGISAELDYAVTDSLVMKTKFDYSKNIKRNKSTYTKIEVAAIYAF